MTCAALFGWRGLISQTILGVCMSGLLASSVSAGEDALRGGFVTTPAYWNWRGFYGGAQMDYKNVDYNFAGATEPLTSYILRNSSLQSRLANWTTLTDQSATGASWGGFVGYNWQWDDIVVGFEANYSRSSLSQSSRDSLGRQFVDNTGAPPDTTYVYSMDVGGNSTVRLTDLATFRARAGWSFGSLLPYGFIGLAVARGDITTTAGVSGTRQEIYTPPCPDPVPPGGCPLPISNTVSLTLPGPQTSTKSGAFFYGGTVGLGFDWALTPNLFVRGEWELVQLQPVEGIDMRINTGRIGLGVKF
jgi:opacity protein-like surface antigen